MSAAIPGVSLLVLLFVILLMVGLTVTIWALVPRRRGTEPLCRACGYNLTGHAEATEPRCPECGADLMPWRATVYGERYRRWGWATVGIITLLFGLVPLGAVAVGSATQFNWYRIAPTWWVISDATNPNSGRLSKAWVELKRRYEAGELSSTQAATLADHCLDEMARPTVRNLALQRANEILKLLITDNVLTEPQWQRLYKNFATFEFAIRKRVVAGDRIPIRVITEGRCPTETVNYRIRQNSLRVGDNPPRNFAGSTSGSVSYGGTGWTGTSVKPDVPPGVYPVEFDVDIEAYAHPSWPDDKGARPVYAVNRVFRAEIEILPEAPPDLVKTRHTPELDAYFATTTLNSVYLRPRRRINHDEDVVKEVGYRLHVTVSFEPQPPIASAFDIWLLTTDGPVKLSSVTRDAGGPPNMHFASGISGEIDQPLDDTVDILLRASEGAARDTTDIYEIWDGEILFKEVEIAPDQSSLDYDKDFTGTVRRRTPNELMPGDE